MRKENSGIICQNIFGLAELVSQMKAIGKKIVLTTGVYDLLHEGHLKYLQCAREMGDFLVVGINSDDFVRKIKGEGKPIFPQKQRAFMIAGFRCVDAVHVFDSRIAIVDAVRPHIFVMSTTSHAKPESRQHQQDVVRLHGGSVIILGEMSTFHSSTIAETVCA